MSNRNHYSSTPLIHMDKTKAGRAVEEDAPVVLEEEEERVRRYGFLQFIVILLLPLGFIASLALPINLIGWLFIGFSLFCVLLMWLLRAFTQGARAKLTLVYVAAAVVVLVKIIVSSPSAVTQRTVSRVDPNSIFSSNTALDTPSLSDIENAAAPLESTPLPEQTEVPISAAQLRLEEFMRYWALQDTKSMVTLCAPSWIDKEENPEATLWRATGFMTPSSYVVEKVYGSNTDSSRAIMIVATVNNSDGSTTRKRYQIVMMRSNDTWYVDPASLNSIGTVTDEDDEPFEQVSSIITNATPSPTPAPTVNPALVLYYNTSGGKYYHLDPYCSSISSEYTPLTGTFTYSQLDDADYRKLTRCPRCGAPARPGT
ncbi:MAG: hypothetical protein IJ240_03050 [Clostridia bacterium]|nr:hypothetical protein [Clostridia bacterium]